MAVFLIVLFSVMAIISMMGMIGDKDADNRKNFTISFCLSVVAIVLFVIKFI